MMTEGFSRSTIRKLAALLLAMSLLAGGCSSNKDNNSDGLAQVVDDAEKAKDVKPPPVASPNLTARPGLVVATNSRTWQNMLKSPKADGVTIMFIQPGGPAADSGLKQGDVITKINGEPSPNAELALVQLRAKPNGTLKLDVSPAGGGGGKTVDIKAEVPGANVDVRTYYNDLLGKKADDPLLRYLRARASGSPFNEAITDVQKAIEQVPNFVEAYALRGELLWNKARDKKLTVELVERYKDQAMSDWNTALKLEPNDTNALMLRSIAELVVQQRATGLRDAEKVRQLDPLFGGGQYATALGLAASNQWGASAEPARKAIELNPFHVIYYQLLAKIFMKLDRPEDAKKTVDAIVDLVPDAATRDALLSITKPTPAPKKK